MAVRVRLRPRKIRGMLPFWTRLITVARRRDLHPVEFDRALQDRLSWARVRRGIPGKPRLWRPFFMEVRGEGVHRVCLKYSDSGHRLRERWHLDRVRRAQDVYAGMLGSRKRCGS